MKRIELSIKTSYLPDWGLWHGIRELIQNGKDAETEHNAPLEVKHYGLKDTLVIQNVGVNLPHEALLLGHTSKVERSDLIGKFGEGLKLGILALCRSGHEIKIQTGEEIWRAHLVDSEQFPGNQVLAFDIEPRPRKSPAQVRVEVKGIVADEWKEMRNSFLFLCERATDDAVQTCYGSLLLAPRMKGRVHVKGIFVQFDKTLAYGYDLSNADIDRDRRLIDRWDLEHKTKRIWEEAVEMRPDLLDALYILLENNQSEVKNFTYSCGSFVAAAMAERFMGKFGAESLPVQNLGDSKALNHLGKRGVIVPEALAAVLAVKMGRLEDVKAALAQEVVETYGWDDLEPRERDTLENAIGIVSNVRAVSLDQISIVRFRSASLLGQFHDGRIILAKKILFSTKETLSTLVHEVAHRNGGDGEKSHVAEIEDIWSTIAINILTLVSRVVELKKEFKS